MTETNEYTHTQSSDRPTNTTKVSEKWHHKRETGKDRQRHRTQHEHKRIPIKTAGSKTDILASKNRHLFKVEILKRCTKYTIKNKIYTRTVIR